MSKGEEMELLEVLSDESAGKISMSNYKEWAMNNKNISAAVRNVLEFHTLDTKDKVVMKHESNVNNTQSEEVYGLSEEEIVEDAGLYDEQDGDGCAQLPFEERSQSNEHENAVGE